VIARPLILWFLLATTAAAQPAPIVRGLDHIPVAVNDLERAEADFQKLGFVLKPGRPHDDGIRNAHAKFPDGTEIELITASNPTDALAEDYARWLKGGDGPAYWSLYAPDLAVLTDRLAALKLEPHDEGDLVAFPQTRLSHRLSSPTVFPRPRTSPRISPTPTPPSGSRASGWRARRMSAG